MRPETEARIRKVQKFGRNGRQFCALAWTMLGIFVFVTSMTIVSGHKFADASRIALGSFYSVTTDQLTTVPAKIWSFVVVWVVLGVCAWILLHVHRLFKQLEAGSIYTKQNVHHLRQIGWASMALAAVQLILPPLSFLLAETGFIDRTLVTFVTSGSGEPALVGSSSFAGFITASLILLASWIMDVGREVSDDAEAMRREADLVI
jgi:hypothetical protein